MDSTLHIVRNWLLLQLFVVPLSIFFGWMMSLQLAQSPAMFFTKASQVPANHPLLTIKNGVVHYLGGVKFPLPGKFGWFSSYLFLVLFPGISTMNSIQKLGLSFVWQTLIPAVVAILLGIPLVLWFRRLQPRWLNEHLATLPPDAMPPGPSVPHATP